MSLKNKIGLILVIVFCVSGLANYAIQQVIIFPSYVVLERDEAIKDLERCQDAINREIFHLSTLARDWSFWDDTYNFVVSRSDEYIKSNLPITSFTDNGINLIYILDLNGRVVWGENHDIETGEILQLPSFPNDTFQQTHPLISPLIDKEMQPGMSVSGIFMSEMGPMLVVTQPILTSNDEGPARGFLIMGRFLNEQLLLTLMEQTGVDFQVFPIGENPLPVALRDIPVRFKGESSYVVDQDDDENLLVYSMVSDIREMPSLLLRGKIPRRISARGNATLQYASKATVISAVLTLVLMLLFLQIIILGPLQNLTNHILAVSRTGTLSNRLLIDRQDEIGILIRNYNDMLEILEKQSRELISVNRKLREDIDARKNAEKALFESEKKIGKLERMESLGLLAGGVAHDLNNILAGIATYPELLLMDNDLSPAQRNAIQIIQSSGQKAATIVADLLTIARGVATDNKILNINARITEYIHSPVHQKLVQHHPSINVKTVLDPGLSDIKGSSIHIDKIVMNLVSNAAEAIGSDGNIIISTTNRYLDKPLKGYGEVKIGEYVVLVVSDDGPGIPEKDLERIFEPFYSKKVLGRSGTGLGLTVVWNTVQHHNGYIDISTSRNGTTVAVYLPITRERETAKKPEYTIEELKGNGQVILIVDDEKLQRVTLSDMAVKLGYKVVSVASGEEAVTYLRDNKVDLILLDMLMDPGINGRETFERIIKIHPHQKAILTSGFSETEEVQEAMKLGIAQYIQKPYSIRKIAKAMKDELEV